MNFAFEQFVSAVREAAAGESANEAVRAILSGCVADPEPINALTPEGGDDEVMLFEDETVSIWRCRFQPQVLMPPHEHLLDVHIAGYAGGEKNILFQRRNGGLVHDRSVVVHPGDVISLDEDCIHAVTAEGDTPSLTLHVYMGPLMKLTRDLFDWDSGDRIDFTMENFDRMKRPASELPAY